MWYIKITMNGEEPDTDVVEEIESEIEDLLNAAEIDFTDIGAM